jgi:hypothetical protein
MSTEDIEVIQEALEVRLHHEDVERAIGRILRHHGSDFDRYLKIVGELRERAQKEGRPVEDVAREIIEARPSRK